MTEPLQAWGFWGDETVQIPVGGEDYQPTGFIGPILSRALYSFYSTVDLADEAFEAPKFFYRRQTKNGYFYYYVKQDEALAACKAAGVSFAPQLQWVFQIETAKVMNTLDNAKLAGGEDGRGFGAVISLSANMSTYRSQMRRHEFHLIALPAAVMAVAKANKWDVPQMDFSRLVGKATTDENDKYGVHVTDEFQKEMIGDPEERDFRQVINECVLGKQRVELWRALGEDDPLKYTLDGVNSKGLPLEWNTEAPKLKACLGVASRVWTAPVFGRLLMVVDPRVNSGGDGKQQSLPALVEVFKTEAEAQAAAKVDTERMAQAKKNQGEAAGSDSVTIPLNHPPVPAVWAELGDVEGITSWLDMVRSIVADHPEITAAKNRPMLMKALKAAVKPEEVGGTPEDVEAWLPLVK
jgi:hypothetical protein